MNISRPKNLGGAKVVDLFCGIGGLTHGFILEGFEVVAGVDNDESCKFAFERNNGSKFVPKDIAHLSPEELKSFYGKGSLKILVGCAPCQPFSSLNRKKVAYRRNNKRWEPLRKFANLIETVKPEIVSMENVPDLSDAKKYPVFGDFLKILKKNKYRVSFRIIDASRYGIPQRRKRLVLLASRLGEIAMIHETHDDKSLVTVRKAISHLRPIKDGEVDRRDPLHRSSQLSELNKKRITSTPKNGGNAKSWPRNLIPSCYKKKSGHTYMSSVYGRMRWDEPAPTMTTHCVSLGTGRFGHPTQNRAISLREAAILQSFPDYYEFAEPQNISVTKTARHIGNAVPVLLGRAIAKSVKKHLASII